MDTMQTTIFGGIAEYGRYSAAILCGRKEDLLLCSDCFLRDVSCRKCCLDHHKYLPFHRIKQWNGRFFASSSLYGQGHIIYKVNRAQVIIMSPRKLRVRTHLWTVQTCSERMQT